jgi:hypothetical protein
MQEFAQYVCNESDDGKGGIIVGGNDACEVFICDDQRRVTFHAVNAKAVIKAMVSAIRVIRARQKNGDCDA